MPRLALTLCGHVGLTVDGHTPPGAPLGAKALALLAYLALEPGPHGREELMTLLWGDFPDAKARASLRQALTHLRHAVGDALVVTRGSVELLAAEVESDVGPVLGRAGNGGGDRRAALRADATRFLSDLAVRRCAGFEEWAESTRRALVRAYGASLADDARAALARLDWWEAVAAADRWRAVEPLSDDAARVAIEARVLGGDRAGALAVYDEHRARLVAECARAPDRALRSLAERILRDVDVVPPAGVGTPAGGSTGAPPALRASLHGREREWGALRRAWLATADDADGAHGRGRVVILEGALGAGKSRLAEDFARWVALHGGTVLRARAEESGAAVPYGVVAEALRSGVDAAGVAGTEGQWLAELSPLVPELRQRLPGIPAAPAAALADGWRFFEAAAQLFLSISAEQPVLVLLDDAHWSDASSAALVASLVRRLADAPVLWCATVTPGSAERGAAGERLVRALRSSPRAETLRLSPLGENDVAAMLRDLGAPDAAADDAPVAARRLLRQMIDAAAGNPRYVMELLRASFARGALARDADGAWRVAADVAPRAVALAELPEVRAPIADRIGRLADDARDVLVTIAVAGYGGCDADTLSHVHGISRLRAAALGETLMERALVVEENGSYRCVHHVVAAVVRSAVSASWCHEVERAIAVLRDGDTAPAAGAGRGPRRPTTGWAEFSTSPTPSRPAIQS